MAAQERAIAVYSRKSRFTGKGESVENQIELCRKFIAAHFPEQPPERVLVYEDEGFSGGNLARPQFQRLLRDAEQGRLSAVVCYRLDRVSRNIGDFARLIERLEALDVAFILIKEQFDTASPMGRAMMYISSVFSQLERETIAERIRDNMLELAKTGRWLGGVCPTGYASEEAASFNLAGKRKKAYRLAVVPEEAELVRLIFRRFLAEGSLTKLETYLLQQGRTSKNGKRFSRFTLKNILANPVYAVADGAAHAYFQELGAQLCAAPREFDGSYGVMVYNRTLQKKGQAHQLRPPGEWIVAVGRHPGLVAGRDWRRVQELLAQNSSRAYRSPRGHQALLSGLLRCAACGAYLRPKQGRVKVDGSVGFRYQCQQKERSKGACCAVANAPGQALDAAVWQALCGLAPAPRAVLAALEGAEARLAAHLTEAETAQARELERQSQNLVESLARTEAAGLRGRLLEELAAVQAEQEQGAARQSALRRRLRQEAFTAAQWQEQRGRLCDPALLLRELPLAQKRQAARQLLAGVVWDGAAAAVVWRGEALPGPNGQSQAAPDDMPER